MKKYDDIDDGTEQKFADSLETRYSYNDNNNDEQKHNDDLLKNKTNNGNNGLHHKAEHAHHQKHRTETVKEESDEIDLAELKNKFVGFTKRLFSEAKTGSRHGYESEDDKELEGKRRNTIKLIT